MADRSKIRYAPYHNRISDTTLLQCGLKPSSMVGVNYKYTHSVKVKEEVVKKERVYELPTHKSPFVVPQIVVGDEDVVEFKTQVSWLLERLNQEKDKLQTVDSKGSMIDCFKNVKMSNFLNRASIKLLNINYVFDNKIGLAMQSKFCNFADLCCAPGGFTYLIKKMNPKNSMISHMFTMPDVGSFLKIDSKVTKLKNIYITYGDICIKKERDEFARDIVVDFSLCDGGIDYTGKENNQEYHSKNLYLSQLLLSMKIVKEGGFIICKFFDMFTRFTASLMYTLSFCFESIKICKISASKAGNSERYILFDNYTVNKDIIKVLEAVNVQLNKKENVISFVDSTDPQYRKFVQALLAANKNLANVQLTALQKYTGKIKINPDTIKNNNSIGYLHCKEWQKVMKN